MYLEIITPDEKVYTGNIKLIQVPGANGSFEVLKMHAPIISVLTEGKIRIVEENDTEKSFEINKGIIEVKQDKIILLAEKI